MLMTLVDIGASDPAMAACRPDWTATQDLALRDAAGHSVVSMRLVDTGNEDGLLALATVTLQEAGTRGVSGAARERTN
jgi:hypothetical protein